MMADGRPRDPIKPPSLRATDLSFALKPLHQIEPLVRSNYLVKGWLDRGAFSVVYGEPNVGKTFFALDMALRLAAGFDWHGHRVVQIGEVDPVIYIAAEGGRGVNNRIEAMRRRHPDLATAAEGFFSLLSEGVDLCAKEDTDALIEVMRDDWNGCRPALIVVDTLARSMGGGDENSGQDMGALIRNIDRLRHELDCHVMLIHHSGKDSARGARGHSSLRGAVDTEIELTRSGKVIVAEAKKQRDIGEKLTFSYELEGVLIGHDEDGDEVYSAVVKPTDRPVKRAPKLRGQQLIAMQALSDAMAHHGEKKQGDMFPSNRQCVSLERWREYCDRHSLSSGDGESSRRAAFHKTRNQLHEKGMIRVIDGFVWRVEE